MEQGDARLAENAISIAYSIIGCAADRSEDHVEAAALLLEQGIQFMQAHELRASEKKWFIEPDPVTTQPAAPIISFGRYRPHWRHQLKLNWRSPSKGFQDRTVDR